MTAKRKKTAKTDIRSVRLESLFRLLERLGLDGAVLDDRDDLFYFTGYTGSDAAAVFSLARRRGWLVTDDRYREEAEQSAPSLETIIWRDGFASRVGLTLAKLGLRKAGHTPASLRLAFFQALRRAAEVGSWRDLGPGIGSLRAVKDAGEVAAMEKALACAEAAFRAARKRWRAGMLEMEIKNDLEWEMRRRGADDAAFETIVAAGA
ncbi:MAG: aminopeptidase P family N-terminal domain-containing protein, partial [Planctomycetota bacterium]|nr:aminopeptidase P family N-terminal domain-containing protein [Planctomycetota bacterium]